MTGVEALLTGMGASVVSSGIIGFAIKTYLEAAIKQRFNLETELLRQKLQAETERLKVDLALRQESQHEMNERRFKAYPLLVELVYRLRNVAREAVQANLANMNATVDDFQARVRALEDCLYGYRIDLQRDHVFASVHAFKNAARTFGFVMNDISYHVSKEELEQVAAARERLVEAYPPLDRLYLGVVESLASVSPAAE